MKRGRLFEVTQERFRSRRFAQINQILRTLLSEKDHVTVLDAGGRPGYWRMLAPDLRDRIKISLINFEDELSLHKEEASGLNIKTVAGDACEMPQFSDGQFDFVHSNSVIEHVGSLQNMKRFAAETRRVGRSYYHQSPDFLFPIEPHYGVPFVHWLPENARVRLFTLTNVGFATRCDFERAIVRVDHTRIISKWMMKNFFPDGKIKREHFLFFPKSIVCYKLPS